MNILRCSSIRASSATIVAALFLCACLVASAGASPAPSDPPQRIFSIRAYQPVGNPSQQIIVRFYFDATSSMAGFVKVHSNNGYRATLQQLEQAVTLGWKNSEIQCWKFGLRADRLNGSTCYTQPESESFFNLPRKDNVTRIDRIVNVAGQSGLDVILTDLYQDDADLGVVFRSIKERVLQHGLAFGIVAMRSPFSGQIYDIGLYRESKHWEGERPWYALVIGGEADVEQFLSQMAKPPLNVPADRLLLFSTRLWNQGVTWSSVSAQPDRMSEDPRLIQVASSSVPVKVFRLQDNHTCGLRLRIVPSAARFRPVIDLQRGDAIRAEVSMRMLAPNGYQDPPAGTAAVQQQGTAINLSWNVDTVLRTAEYAEQVRVDFNPDAVRFPSFTSDWSVSLHDVLPDPTDKHDAQKKFDGSKTQNLSEFVHGLWALLVQQKGTGLGDLYLYLRR